MPTDPPSPIDPWANVRRYNCDCLESLPDGRVAPDDVQGFYCERGVYIADDVDAARAAERQQSTPQQDKAIDDEQRRIATAEAKSQLAEAKAEIERLKVLHAERRRLNDLYFDIQVMAREAQATAQADVASLTQQLRVQTMDRHLLERASRMFNSIADLRTEEDQRINEWFKAQLAAHDRCARCGQLADAEIHYGGTVDGHAFTR